MTSTGGVEMAEKTMLIQNELGLHARAATKLVQLASKYPCEVTVSKDGPPMNSGSESDDASRPESGGTQASSRMTIVDPEPSWSVVFFGGGLIHAASGTIGGCGTLRTKRSGWRS